VGLNVNITCSINPIVSIEGGNLWGSVGVLGLVNEAKCLTC